MLKGTIKRRELNEVGQPLSEVLTTRQLEVLALIVKDYTNKQIANALFISDQTVKNIIMQMMAITGCQSRTGLVVRYLNDGRLLPDKDEIRQLLESWIRFSQPFSSTGCTRGLGRCECLRCWSEEVIEKLAS